MGELNEYVLEDGAIEKIVDSDRSVLNEDVILCDESKRSDGQIQ